MIRQELQKVVETLNPDVPVTELRTLRKVVSESATSSRSTTVLFAIFACLPCCRLKDGTVTVDVRLEAALPQGARPDLSVDGTIVLEKLDDVVYGGRPVQGQPDSQVSLFKLDPDGKGAARVTVKLGRSSVNTIEIKAGLKPGDQVILSDMTAQDGFDRIRLN